MGGGEEGEGLNHLIISRLIVILLLAWWFVVSWRKRKPYLLTLITGESSRRLF